MRSFISELHHLSELYQNLKREFTGLAGKAKSGNVTAVIDETLRNRELLGRIEQMNMRVAQLAQEWELVGNQIDASTRRAIVAFAASVRNQGTQLSLLCNGLLGELEARRGNLERQLADVRRGSRYLQSVKPVKNNYPKFVDSVG